MHSSGRHWLVLTVVWAVGWGLAALVSASTGEGAARLCMPECKHKVTVLPPKADGKECFLVAASHGGPSKEVAVARSRQALKESLRSWANRNGLAGRRASIEAMRSPPLPFVRSAVTADLYFKPDVVTKEVHTTCWKGITLPVACTSASKVCA